MHSCGVRRLGSYVYLGTSLKFTVATTFNTPIKSFIESSIEKSNCLYLEAPEASMLWACYSRLKKRLKCQKP